jgi:hypothetical protein
MKHKEVSEWESQWTSDRRLEQIATQRAELEDMLHSVGWRRNYVVLSALVVGALFLLTVHFS